MYIFLRILLFIWCLPQNIVGFIFVKIKKGTMYIFAPDAGTYSTKNIFIKFVRWVRTKLLVNEYYYIEDKKGIKKDESGKRNKEAIVRGATLLFLAIAVLVTVIVTFAIMMYIESNKEKPVRMMVSLLWIIRYLIAF